MEFMLSSRNAYNLRGLPTFSRRVMFSLFQGGCGAKRKETVKRSIQVQVVSFSLYNQNYECLFVSKNK